MFLLLFPPAATGWLDLIDDAESVDGVKSHGRKWVHIAARATVAAEIPPAPGKEIGGSKMRDACGPVGDDWQNGATEGSEHGGCAETGLAAGIAGKEIGRRAPVRHPRKPGLTGWERFESAAVHSPQS
jgi:hypothetical protein